MRSVSARRRRQSNRYVGVLERKYVLNRPDTRETVLLEHRSKIIGVVLGEIMELGDEELAVRHQFVEFVE
jgi:hypothetical protein